MILTVIAEYRNSPVLRMLAIEESTGETELIYLDTSDAEQLRVMKDKLDKGVTYADFLISEYTNSEGTKSLELRHTCSDVAPGEPDEGTAGYLHLDSLSLSGFIRLLISEGGKIVLPLENVPEDNIPSWMIANPNTIQYGNDFSMRVSHTVPAETEGYWKWSTTYLVSRNLEGQWTDFGNLTFLAPIDFDAQDFEELFSEYKPLTVINEDGSTHIYKSFKIKDIDIPVYPRKNNIMLRPQSISLFKFIADSYKLALTTLSQGLFESKKIERGDSIYQYGRGQDDIVLHVKLETDHPLTKKVAEVLLNRMSQELTTEVSKDSKREFLKQYPFYDAYKSIIQPQINTFFDPNGDKAEMFRNYHSLKNVEAYCNLMLAELRHHLICNDNARYFKSYTTTGGFYTDIPHYKIYLTGGGSGWRRNDTF